MIGALLHSTFAEVELFGATAALNRIYEGYVMPFSMSEAQTALHLTVNDIDAAASPLWYDGDDVVAAALVGFRGERAWIGGFGVVPERRGAGIGRELLVHVLANCRERARNVQLEVLLQNAAAIAAYDRAGFRARRRLVSYSTDPSTLLSVPAKVGEIAPPLDLADVTGDARPSWQCERASLERQPDIRAIGRGDDVLIFRSGETVAQILGARVAGPAQLSELTAGLAALTGVRKILAFNQIDDGGPARAAREAGWTLAFAQHEMHLAL